MRGVAHPERPDRVEVVAARLRESGLLTQTIPARDATDAEIERIHTAEYLELVERETSGLTNPRYLSTGDTVVDARSYAAARRAAGGAIVAVETSAGNGEAVFALVRPPGHHAEPARGMGFCLFNNVAIAARAYQSSRVTLSPSTPLRTGLVEGGRVLIADFDYHHGNGTEAVAGHGLSYFSTHAYPAYPGTGATSYRRGSDIVLNVPLPAVEIPTETFVAIWEQMLPIVAQAVRPDLLIVSAGFDYVAGDSVGDLGVGVEAAAPLAAAIRRTAEEHCHGSVAYVLEGGYDLDALTGSIASIIVVSDASQTPPVAADPKAVPREMLHRTKAMLRNSQGGTQGATN